MYDSSNSGWKLLVPGFWKPMLLLLIITPILTELLTNNITTTSFFKPRVFFMFAVLVYGPVLLLRELAVRWNLSLAGYILLGLVYGIYNEGLLGKTFFNATIAGTVFNNYGFVWGINFSWASTIIVFHAFYGMLFPVLIINYFFPKAAFTPWLHKKWWLILSAACFLYISYSFLKNTRPATSWHYVALVTVMIVLVWLAKIFKAGSSIVYRPAQKVLLFACGIIFVLTTFTIAAIIAVNRVQVIFYLLYMLVNLLVAILLLNKKYGTASLLIFALAAQLGFEASLIIVAMLNHIAVKFITILLAVIFSVGLAVLLIKKNEQPTKIIL